MLRKKKSLQLISIFFFLAVCQYRRTEATNFSEPAQVSGLSIRVVQGDVMPVTVNSSWDPLSSNQTGIPDSSVQEVMYQLNISDTTSSNTTTTSATTILVKGLASCVNYTATVTAFNSNFTGQASDSFPFMTLEIDPVTVSIDSPSDDPVERTVGTSVTLNCTWDSAAYYFGWYKDGSLVYAMDLASGEVLNNTLSATSSYEGRYSELTIPGSSLADSGNYTCVVSCEGRDVALDDIPEALRDSKDVLFYGVPETVDGLTAKVVEGSPEVKVLVQWSRLLPNETGIPVGGNTSLVYTVRVSYMGVTPREMAVMESEATFDNLPACENLTISVTANNTLQVSTSAEVVFTTNEMDPVTVSIDLPPNDPVERTVGTSVTLNCTWDSTAYYFGWYKDGSLVYAMDLAFGEVLTDTQSATSSYEGRYSELTIPGSSLADSGSYTCVVSCEARDVALDDIPEALRDSKDVLFYGVPETVDGLTAKVVEGSPEVKVLVQWSRLLPNETGIPVGGNTSLVYTVRVSYMGVTPREMAVMESEATFDNLPACENLTISVTANNTLQVSTSAEVGFTTNEMDPVTVSIDSPSDDPVEMTVGTSVTLNCTWDSTAYYFGWYKDGSLVYAMDLASGEVLTDTQSATSSYEGRYSELTIPGSSLADSGNYTCVVSCEARDMAVDGIPEALKDSKEVCFYDVPVNITGLEISIPTDDQMPVTAMITWNALSGSDQTGISDGCADTVEYNLTICDMDDTIVHQMTYSDAMATVYNLASCSNYTAKVLAVNKLQNGWTAQREFQTIENDPVTVIIDDPVERTVGTSVTLNCAWYPTAYYLGWYKDGSLVYAMDLASGEVLNNTLSATSSYEVRSSELTIPGSSLADSGNYTCVVSCEARDMALDDIPEALKDSKEVCFYAVPVNITGLEISIPTNDQMPVTAMITWNALSGSDQTGISDGCADTVEYNLTICNADDTIVHQMTYSDAMATVYNLASCRNYTAKVMAVNKLQNGWTAQREFETVENDLVSATIRIPPESMQYLIGVDNDITLSCDWNESAFYLAWFKNRLPIYAIDLISKKVELNSTPFMFDLPASGIRRLNMSIQNGFLNDSGNYTCAVSCKAREAVNGEMDRTAILETYGDTREILILAKPSGLSAERLSMSMNLTWMAPSDNRFMGSYRVSINTTNPGPIITSDTYYYIDNLESYQVYEISVEANSSPVRPFGPPLTRLFNTLPSTDISGGGKPPSIGLPNGAVGEGSTTVTITIPEIQFADGANLLSHVWLVCIRNLNGTTRSKSPDEAFGDPSTFGSFSTAQDGQAYVISEIGIQPGDLPMDFTIGDGSVAIVRQNSYVNGAIKPGTTLDCFIRYFVTNQNVADSARRRRRADPPDSRQYNIFSSTNYRSIVIIQSPPNNATDVGLIVGLVVLFVVIIALLVLIIALLVFLFYRRRKYPASYPPRAPSRQGSFRLRENVNLHVNQSAIPNNEIKRPCKVDDFEAYAKKKHKNSDQIFQEEYELLSIKSPTLAHSVGSESFNVPKNRYANIHSYDSSRVVLSTIEDRPGSDYINANFIDSYRNKKTFIATQGPLVNTTHDFWRMVWEQNSRTIVVLTNLVEKTRVKCHQYWPDPVGSSADFGDLTVTLIDQQELAHLSLRTFDLVKEHSKEHRQIHQIHYTAWPDFGVPEQAIPILQLIKRMDEFNPQDVGPIITHCSAGVGRTGTLIAIHGMMQMIEDRGEIDIYNFILGMRSQRTYMVQTEKQYIFVHSAVLEYLKIRGYEAGVKGLRNKVNQLSQEDQNTGLTGFISEFANLEALDFVDDALLVNGTLPVNTHKNRHKDVMPYDTFRVRLTMFPGIEGSDYINSTYLDGYHRRNQFILSQGPLETTVFDFWRMIWETRCQNIVMLCDLVENGNEQCARYWPLPEEGVVQYGAFLLETEKQTENSSGYIVRDISITNVKHYNERRILKQFHYNSWPNGSIPTSSTNIVNLIGVVTKTQPQGSGPVVIHDSGSVGRSATFLALCNILERMKTERLVDIFTTVRSMRLRQPRAVQSLELYTFLYQASVDYLDSFDHYANFD